MNMAGTKNALISVTVKATYLTSTGAERLFTFANYDVKSTVLPVGAA